MRTGSSEGYPRDFVGLVRTHGEIECKLSCKMKLKVCAIGISEV